jgi:DNA invertase Pin-like site-specific DNA recombinase
MKYGYAGQLESNLWLSKQEQVDELAIENYVIEESFTYKGKMGIDRLIERLTSKDTIEILSLKYLARNMKILLKRLQAIEEKGITLIVRDIPNCSLVSHASALREFSRYIASSKMKLVMKKINHRKGGNITHTHKRSKIKNWHTQRDIKVLHVQGKATPTELAKKYGVSRPTIYRILKKEEFKDVKEPLPYDYELWDLEKCKEKTKVTTYSRPDNTITVLIMLSSQCIFRREIEIGKTTPRKVLKQFLAKPDDELRKIYFNLTKGKNL